MGTIPLETAADQDWEFEAVAVVGDGILSVCPKNIEHNIEQYQNIMINNCPQCGAKYTHYPAAI